MVYKLFYYKKLFKNGFFLKNYNMLLLNKFLIIQILIKNINIKINTNNFFSILKKN